MLFNLSGEKVYEISLEGKAGKNDLLWNLENQSGQRAASGLYVYVLTLNDGTTVQVQRGKVALLR